MYVITRLLAHFASTPLQLTRVSIMENEELTINATVTPALHAHVFQQIDGLNDDTRKFVAPAIDAFETAVISLSAIHELRLLANKNKALTDEGRTLQVAAFADKKVAEVSKKMDSAHDLLKKQITFTEEQLQAPLEATVHAGPAAEIRGLVRAMDADERRLLITGSIEAGDTQVLSALLASHPMLSGLTRLEVAQYTRIWRERSQPELANRLAVMQKAFNLLGERSGLVLSEAEKLIGADRAKVNALRDADTKFSRALAR